MRSSLLTGVLCAVHQVPDPKLKYQQLLAYGKKLPPLPAEDHTEDNKVRGCVSQVSTCNPGLIQHAAVLKTNHISSNFFSVYCRCGSNQS